MIKKGLLRPPPLDMGLKMKNDKKGLLRLPPLDMGLIIDVKLR